MMKVTNEASPRQNEGERKTERFFLQESALLQESGHFLVFAFPGFALKTNIPELLTPINGVIERAKRFFDECEDRGQRRKVEVL